MGLADGAENSLLLLLFNNTNWANVGDATGLRGSTVAGNFYISLHTATLTDTATQTTSEAAYGSYARQAVARASGAGGWSVAANAATNVSAITFPTAASGSETETNFAVGRDVSGVGQVLWYGALTSNLAVSINVQPNFAASALSCTID